MSSETMGTNLKIYHTPSLPVWPAVSSTLGLYNVTESESGLERWDQRNKINKKYSARIIAMISYSGRADCGISSD